MRCRHVDTRIALKGVEEPKPATELHSQGLHGRLVLGLDHLSVFGEEVVRDADVLEVLKLVLTIISSM